MDVKMDLKIELPGELLESIWELHSAHPWGHRSRDLGSPWSHPRLESGRQRFVGYEQITVWVSGMSRKAWKFADPGACEGDLGV